jgi:hypothetical protein
MRAERPVYPGERPRVTAPERVMVAVVIIAIALFELWFFFLSGSPIDQRSGRGEVRPVPVSTAQGSITCSGSGCSPGGAAL